jgi:hypothetical protein
MRVRRAHLVKARPRYLIRISKYIPDFKDFLNQNHLSFGRLNGKQTIVIALDASALH